MSRSLSVRVPEKYCGDYLAFKLVFQLLTTLQDQVDRFNQSRGRNERLRKWLNLTINVLYAFSVTLGEGVGLAFSPTNVIFAGVDAFLLAAKDVYARQDLFEHIENFFRSIQRPHQPPTITGAMVKIMVEVLDILATCHEGNETESSKVAGVTNLEDGIKGLDKLTKEEAMEVGDGVKAVEKNVQVVGTQVRKIDANILGVGAKVKDVNGELQVVNNSVKVIEENSLDSKAIAEEMRLDMQRTADDIDDMKRSEQLRDSLKKWQSSLDPSTNHNIACGRQHGGMTGLLGSVFEEWKLTGSLLWIHGKPGSGNLFYGSSLLISGNIRNSMVVDQLRNH
ncbi:hypothetical protein EDB83DRAFT_2575724 [Lactarius deliciosus]|nr:hypothetical protein EDB83DRAFT_2575724 [Lactarius deliciosus]